MGERAIADWGRCSQQTIAQLLGLSTRAVRKWEGCPRNSDKTYNLQDVLSWYLEMKGLRASALSALSQEEREDPELVKAALENAPARERFMHYRARREQLKCEQEERHLVDRGVVHAFLMDAAGRIRACADKLQQRFGPDAVDVMNEAMDELEVQIEQQMGAGE